jgi:hypothetical protein
MRLISLSVIIFITILLSCDTASNVEPTFESYFTKYYGEDGEQVGVDIVLNADGSMILLGNSFSQSASVSPFIVKTDPLGNIIWQVNLRPEVASSINETAVDIEPINGGQFVLVSNVQDTVTSIRIYIINQDGSIANSVTLKDPESPENHVAKSITQSSDNGFLITGYKAPDPIRNPEPVVASLDQADILLLKVNSSLDFEPLARGGGEQKGSGVKAYEFILNNTIYYLVFGYSDQPLKNEDPFQLRYQLFSVDAAGTPAGVYGFSESDPQEEQIASTTLKIPASSGDGYLTVGTATSLTGSESDLHLTRFVRPEKPGEVLTPLDTKVPLTNRRIQGVSAANAAPDGFFIVANEIRDNNKRDIFLLKVERNGSVTWTTSFGSLEGEDTGAAVAALPDGRIAVVGTIELETQRKMVLIVTNPNGQFSD